MVRFGMKSLIAGLALTIVASTGVGQQLGQREAIETVLQKNSQSRSRLINGSQTPTPADDALIDAIAQDIAFRVSWPTVRNDNKNLADAVDAVMRMVDQLEQSTPKKTNREFVAKLGPPLAKHLKEHLTQKGKEFLVSQVNCAQMLPSLARLKQEEFGNLMAELLVSTDVNLAVRRYVAEALGEFPVEPILDAFVDPRAPKYVARKKRDVMRVEALVKFIEKDWSNEKADDEAVRFIRYYAISALAESKAVAVYVPSKGKPGDIEGMIADTLLKVLSKGAMKPEPSLKEKLAAANGLAMMKSPPEDVNSKLCVHLVGKTLLDYFNYYSSDHANFGVKQVKSPAKIFTKVEARRLEQSLKEMANTYKGTEAGKLAKALDVAAAKHIANAVAGQAIDLGLVIQDLTKGIQAARPKDGETMIIAPPRIAIKTFSAVLD